MKKLILCFCLLTATYAIPVVRKSNGITMVYHKSQDTVRRHRGAAGMVTGALGTMVIQKLFEKEIQDYLKPFIKGVCDKVKRLLRRIINRDKKA